ncbi:ABC transporter permease subunit [Kitasatospora sp. MAA4]|uniref:ABC transporter permease subunit n=1 Tax=Kitasatospora sp. MAA4 TaxID=3035093 RepID=UPI00247544D1|nr:ABC transporter permease subunit [Kitasatospora sp. MAA4]
MIGQHVAVEAIGLDERTRLRPRGLGWLVWRQHRALVWFWLAAVLVAVVGFPFLRGAMVSYIDSHHIAGCAEISNDPNCQGEAVQGAVDRFRMTYGDSLKGIGWLLRLLPTVLGVLVGAPLLARELEGGTWRLVATQSYSARRWLAAKLLRVGLLCALGSAVLALLFRWVWQPSANEVSGISWFSTSFVASGGPLLVAGVLLALAVGVAAGALVRRVVPAMGATLAVLVALQVALSSVRPYLWPWHTEIVPMSELPNSVWGIAQGYLRPDGTRLPYGDPCGGNDVAGCGADVREFTDVHHAADYWPLQLVECGICLVLAAALVLFTLRWSARRFG